MKRFHASILTRGFDPVGFIAFADHLEETGAFPPDVILWRCRGLVGLAVKEYIDRLHEWMASPVKLPHLPATINLPHGCHFKPRLTPALLHLQLNHTDVQGTTTTVVRVGNYQLLRNRLDNPRYMRWRVLEMADLIWNFARLQHHRISDDASRAGD